MSGSVLGGYSSNSFHKQYYDQSQNSKVTVRIRGRHNEFITKQGTVHQSLDEQKILMVRHKEMKKANIRLKNLEKLEYYRMDKVRKEIERLEEERKREGDERLKKKKEENQKRKFLAKKRQKLEEQKMKREAQREVNIMKKKIEDEE
jgi:hypothetical protein